MDFYSVVCVLVYLHGGGDMNPSPTLCSTPPPNMSIVMEYMSRGCLSALLYDINSVKLGSHQILKVCV